MNGEGLYETSHQHTENVFLTNTCRRATTGHELPVTGLSKRPFQRPLHFETCRTAYAHNSARLVIEKVPFELQLNLGGAIRAGPTQKSGRGI